MNKEFIAGWASGMLGTAVGYPFDVIKTNCQVSQLSTKASYMQIYNKFGVIGFTHGILSPLLTRALVKGVLFSAYTHIYTLIGSNSYTHMGMAGALAGVANSFVASPFELVKIANQRNLRFRDELLSKGVGHLTRGLGETIIREAPYYFFYFPLYQGLKDLSVPSFLSGGIAGTLPWIVIYPLDVIKTHKQTPNHACCLPQFMRTYGYRGLYKGLVPTIMRAFPTHGVTWLAYECIIQKINIC
jgi:hypothetical protein